MSPEKNHIYTAETGNWKRYILKDISMTRPWGWITSLIINTIFNSFSFQNVPLLLKKKVKKTKTKNNAFLGRRGSDPTPLSGMST